MKKFYILALVAAMFAACATDVTEDVAIEAPETLKVSFEESSRIQLDYGETVWTKGDLVSVFYKSYENMQWQFEGETGDKSGTLKCIKGNIGEQTMDNVVIAYPYSDKYAISLTTGGLDAVLPAEQSYMYNSFGLDASLMVANSEFTQFTLKNVLGWLKVQLKGDGQIVEKITLKGNNNEQVAGLIHIDTTTATATLSSNGSNEDNYDEVSGTLVFDNAIIKEVTLNCNEYVKLDSYTTSFYIALPPQTFTNGLTIEVTCNDGTTMTKSTEKSITIERNTIQPMAEFEFAHTTPANNEIWYTNGSTTQKTTPRKTDIFGSNIVSNLYDAEKKCWVITFDGEVTSIGLDAFYNRTLLTSITIPDSVTSIEDGAFYGCSGMTEITIPSSVTSIGTSSFTGCGGKANINCKIAGGNNWEEGKFCRAKFTEVVIGNNVTSIGDYAFYYCTSLTSVTIPDSVTEIGEHAFYDCTSLKDVYYTGDLSAWCKIDFSNHLSNPMNEGAKLYLNGVELTEATIPSNVTEIKDYTFSRCASLTSVTIPDSVTEIGICAFSSSTLTSVTIGDSVTSIGESAFCYCSWLKEVYCKPTTPPSGDIYMFLQHYGSDLKIYVPRASVNAYKAASYWSTYKGYIEPYDFK